MNILVTNNHLDTLGGTEKFTFDLIEELNSREEIDVEYFTLRKGIVSEKIESELGVRFMSKKKYDLILANHNSTVEKVWKYGFTIQTIHGIFNFIEKPSVFADAYISISEEIQKNLAYRNIPSIIIYNGINHSKISNVSLNKTVKSLVSMSQSTIANNKIAKACSNLGIEFIRLDKFKDKVWDVYKIINRADIVVGLGRSAYDAMACGRPVIVYDEREYNGSKADGYLPDYLHSSIKNNCSGRYFKKEFTVKDIENEILKYKKVDGNMLKEFSIEHLNIKSSVNQYLKYYHEVSGNNYFNKQSLLKRLKLLRVLGPFINLYNNSNRSKIL